jgi:hypothetical protein
MHGGFPSTAGCDCPRQHDSSKGPQRAFRSFLCPARYPRPRAHHSVWPERDETKHARLVLRPRPGPPPTTNQLPSSHVPADPHLTLLLPVFLRFFTTRVLLPELLCCCIALHSVLIRSSSLVHYSSLRLPSVRRAFPPLPLLAPDLSIAPSLSSILRHTTPSHRIISSSRTRSHTIGCAFADSWLSTF